MQLNQIIRSKKDLLKHFGSSQKLEILDLKQMYKLLGINVQPEVWEDASKRNLFSFSQEFVQQTQVIRFYGSRIEYIYLVSFLTNLTELNLSENKILDISSISKLKNLKKLNLSVNFIDDISALSSLHDLTHLYLYQNKLTFYTLTLPNLVELFLSGNKLQDKSGLQHSPKLEKLILGVTKTVDLCNISQLLNLKSLILGDNNLTEISYLSNLLDLQILELGGNKQLQNIGPLKFCSQLTDLRIFTTSISDIWPLQFMKNLNTLYMQETKVVDLHPLQNLYKLEFICAHDTCIIDVSPLSKLTQLKQISFSDNYITNADTLKHKNFSEQDFSDQQVPTTDELKFYNKILKVHSSHKQIRIIQYEKSVSKFRASLASKKNYVSAMLNNQIMMMNKEVGMFMQFVQNSNTYLD
ncbi:Conserved_hypothetical protein [Hexamita inflata]|uniref:Uncharacterized protein n=1 Tax=Hexamita inflata TaxID=28002 RepID=A0ABP1GGN6_9EUKA